VETPDERTAALALARIQIDQQAGQGFAGRSVADAVGLHVGVPERHPVDARVLHAQHPLDDAHRHGQAFLHREVAAKRFLVDRETRVAYAFGVKRGVPALEPDRIQRLTRRLRLCQAQVLDLEPFALGHGAAHVGEETSDLAGVAGHLPAQDEVRIAASTEQLGQFLAQLAELGQEVKIGSAALGVVGPPEALARDRIDRVLQHRQVGRIVNGNHDASLRVPLGIRPQ
jgi:hypothetical protein